MFITKFVGNIYVTQKEIQMALTGVLIALTSRLCNMKLVSV